MLKTVDAFMLRTVVHKGTADILHTGYQFNIDNKITMRITPSRTAIAVSEGIKGLQIRAIPRGSSMKMPIAIIKEKS